MFTALGVAILVESAASMSGRRLYGGLERQSPPRNSRPGRSSAATLSRAIRPLHGDSAISKALA